MFSATSALDTCPVLLWFHKWKSHNCGGFFTRVAVSHHTPKGETVIQSFSMIPIIFTVKKHNWFNRLMDKTFSFLRADSMKSKIIHGVHYFPMLTICCYHPEAFWLRIQFPAHGDPSGLPSKCDSSSGQLKVTTPMTQSMAIVCLLQCELPVHTVINFID